MARHQTIVRKVAFSQLDELTREISKMASLVNARFVVDSEKLKELKASSDATVKHTITRKRITRS